MSSTRSIIAPPPFATNALTVIPPTPVAGVSYRDPIAGPASSPDGWPYAERVNSAEFNQIMYQATSLISIMDHKGVLGWSDLVDYPESSIQFGSDGFLYRWLQASGPTLGGAKDPVSSPTFWEAAGSGQLISTRRITSSGLVSPTPGTKYWRVRGVGGGGGGGGAAATGAAQVSAGAGGASGSWFETVLTAAQIGSGLSVTIGVGGAGGAAGATGGFGGGTIIGPVTAPGGQPGAAGGAISTTANAATAGGLPGGATIGATILSSNGMQGGHGVTLGSTTLSGSGGSCPFGAGGRQAAVAQPGTGYGSGGGASQNNVSSSAAPGAAGAPGVLIIEEYA